MLSVKSRESKNSGNKTSFKSWAWLLLSPLIITPHTAYSAAESVTNPASIASIFLSLLIVIAVIFMLGYLMRRFNVTSNGSSQLQVVASMAAGTKERIMVIKVGDEQHLVGVTTHNINHMAKLDNALPLSEPTSGDNFKQKLAEMMNPALKQKQNGGQRDA